MPMDFIMFRENMRLYSLLLVCIAICCICVSGCTTAHTNHQASPNELTSSTQQTSTPYATSEQTVQTSTEAANDFSQVTHASVSTMRENWDADAEDDGITVHPNLLDQYDETVKYSDASIPIDIQIWTTKFDDNFKEQKDKLVYKGSGTITTWKDGNMFMKGGIKVPFSSMNVPSDEMFGWTYVTIHTPDGKTYEAVDKFTALTP
ncbi:MAG: hypothetical protein PWP08_815 [Methanofollis sp.]|nr:hypothetical protein [Methanofollis sp.]